MSCQRCITAVLCARTRQSHADCVVLARLKISCAPELTGGDPAAVET